MIHKYDKEDLINRFDAILGKCFLEIDDKDIFENVINFPRQKGIAGTVIEQCVLGYSPNSEQAPDLIVVDNGKEIETELKTTGMVISHEQDDHYIAKEPMSITAVGIYNISDQEFYTSHFWKKIQHMLLVYYHYKSKKPVTAYEYRYFPIKGYEFHEFSESEVLALKQDWENVHDLIKDIVDEYPCDNTKEWKELVRKIYIQRHGTLRKVLNYIDLAPKFPPRFRFKKPLVSHIISKHFKYNLEQLPGEYNIINDIDKKCHQLTEKYSGKTIKEIFEELNVNIDNLQVKNLAEEMVCAMFGAKSKKLNKIEMFNKFGLVGKTVVLTPKGKRTEDVKLYRVNFNEMVAQETLDEETGNRKYQFEDSDLYKYFTDNEFLCVILQEPEKEYDENKKEIYHPLYLNKFIGFKRLVFSEDFINSKVKYLWGNTRNLILNDNLEDVVRVDRNGNTVYNKSGGVSSAPNFVKSKDNDVFLRGSSTDSSMQHKTEIVNGINMLPQYVWMKGKSFIEELEKIELL